MRRSELASNVSSPRTLYVARGKSIIGSTTSLLMEADHLLGFEYAYGWNIYYQQILGICEKNNEGWLGQKRAWIWSWFVFSSIWIPQVASLAVHWGDMNAFIICLSTNMPIAISILKIMVLQKQRKVIGGIVATVQQDWLRVEGKMERSMMIETAKTSRSISILSFSLTNVMFVEYICSRLWKLWEGPDSRTNPELAFGFLHDCYYPFNTTTLETFIPIWIFQFFGTYLGMISYAGPDCFVSMVILHFCGQLMILRRSFENLIDEATISDPKKYWKKIAAIVTRHEQINSLTIVIKMTFSSILLVQMLACSMTFCFQAYAMFTTLMDRDGEPLPLFDLGFSIIYAVYTVIHLFIYCYVGDCLFVESTSLADDFYKTEWYTLPPRQAKAFIMISQRSRIPLEIKAGKFCTFNLQLFNAILKNSMGYLSMLIAVKQRSIG